MPLPVDTNVVSELIRRSPDPAVADWVAARSLHELFFSAVGEAELRYGAAILASGRRRETLAAAIEHMLDEAFEDRILPFDSEAVRAYVDIAARRRSVGRTMPLADMQIAAIARSRGWFWQRVMFGTSRTSALMLSIRGQCHDWPHGGFCAG